MKQIFFGSIIFILLLVIIINLAIQYNTQILEGYTNDTNYCKSTDNDYNNPNVCYDINYMDESGNTVKGKSRLSEYDYISHDGKIKQVPDNKLFVPSDNKLGYSPIGVNGITICESGDPSYNDTNTCKKVKYIDNHDNLVSDKLAKLSDRVYLDSSRTVIQVPNGYQSNSDHSGYIPKKKSEIYKAYSDPSMNDNKPPSGTSYNTNNLDITYHADPTTQANNASGPGKMIVKDPSGNLVSMSYSDISNTTLYYEPSTYRFGPSNYVPNYEESVYLSKLTNEPTTTTIVNNKAGFCKDTKAFPQKTEEKCNSLSPDVCASTDCCVLLGGAKCVAGNESGPIIRSNYSDFTIINRDYYYYKGKCFGNCDNKN